MMVLFNGTIVESTVKIVFKGADRFENTGGYLRLANGTNARLYGSSIQVIFDILELTNLTLIPHFEDWFPAVDVVGNGSYDWGAPLMSVDEGLLAKTRRFGNGIVFLHPLLSVSSDVFFRQPLPENIRTTVFHPFQLLVWISILLFMITGSILTYCSVMKTSVIPWQNQVTTVLLGVFQFILGRSPSIVKHAARGYLETYLQIVILSISYLATYLALIYTAKIASTLAKNEAIVKTPTDLLKYGYRMTTYSNFHFDRLFSNSDTVKKLHQVQFNGGTDAVVKVVGVHQSDPRFALLTHPDGFFANAQLSNHLSAKLCLVSSFSSSVKTAQAMYVRKDWPYRKQINIRIVQSIERGLNNRYQRNFKRLYTFDCISKQLSYTVLTIKHVSFAFLTLITGALVALIIEAVVFIEVRTKRLEKFYDSFTPHFLKRPIEEKN